MIIQLKKKTISSTKGTDSRLYSEMLRFSGTNPSILHETKVKVEDNQSKNKQTLRLIMDFIQNFVHPKMNEMKVSVLPAVFYWSATKYPSQDIIHWIS